MNAPCPSEVVELGGPSCSCASAWTATRFSRPRRTAKLWGFDELGSLAVGRRARFLVLAADPRIEPRSVSEPEAVYVDGELQPPSVVGAGDIAG